VLLSRESGASEAEQCAAFRRKMSSWPLSDPAADRDGI
jgi:hypothetical protein